MLSCCGATGHIRKKYDTYVGLCDLRLEVSLPSGGDVDMERAVVRPGYERVQSFLVSTRLVSTCSETIILLLNTVVL